MLIELKSVPEKVGLRLNLRRTKIMTPEETPIYVGEELIDTAKEHVYLGNSIKPGKENQIAK